MVLDRFKSKCVANNPFTAPPGKSAHTEVAKIHVPGLRLVPECHGEARHRFVLPLFLPLFDAFLTLFPLKRVRFKLECVF